jgi:hypothetical protein
MPLEGQAFGLRLATNDRVPGLDLTDAAGPCKHAWKEADVVIWLNQRPQFGVAASAGNWSIWYNGPEGGQSSEPVVQVWRLPPQGHFRIRYQDGVEFWVDALGRQVWSTWPANRTPEDAAVYLLGPILGLVLRLRGVTCVHASAVAIDGQAIMLVGPGGAGKSTAAAAFAMSGFSVLSDDVSALTRDGEVFVVQPGIAHVKLWPDTVERLYGTRDALPKLIPSNPAWDKRYLRLTDSFEHSARPLGAVYVIGSRGAEQGAPVIAPLIPGQAFLALVANTYVNYLLTPQMRAEEFNVLSWMTQHVPLRTVTPGAALDRIHLLTAAVANDFRSLQARSRESVADPVLA